MKGNRKKFELSGVRVIGSLRQKTGSKEISKLMGRECNSAIKPCTGMDTEFELEWQKVKERFDTVALK